MTINDEARFHMKVKMEAAAAYVIALDKLDNTQRLFSSDPPPLLLFMLKKELSDMEREVHAAESHLKTLF